MEVFLREQVGCQCIGEEDCKENREVKFLDGSSLPSIPYLGKDDDHRGEWPENERCHDCGCLPGKFHHPGCDMEICPCCKQQAIGCGCLNDWRAHEKQEKQLEKENEKQSGILFRQWERDRRERFCQILRQDPEYNRLHKEGYTFLCNGGPAPVHFDEYVLQLLNKKSVKQEDVVQCSSAYDNDGELIPGEISLWGKMPKIIAQKSDKTFEFKWAGSMIGRACWSVWYEGNSEVKGYGMTKKDGVYDLESKYDNIRCEKLYP